MYKCRVPSFIQFICKSFEEIRRHHFKVKNLLLTLGFIEFKFFRVFFLGQWKSKLRYKRPSAQNSKPANCHSASQTEKKKMNVWCQPQNELFFQKTEKRQAQVCLHHLRDARDRAIHCRFQKKMKRFWMDFHVCWRQEGFFSVRFVYMYSNKPLKVFLCKNDSMR